MNLINRIFDRSRIARKLVLAIVLFSSVITLIATGLQIFLDYKHDMKIIEGNLGLIESSYLASLTNSVWSYNEGQIRSQLEGLLRLPDMEALEIRVDGKTVWSAGAAKSGHTIEADFPMLRDDYGREISIGVLHAVASLDAVYDRLIGKVLVILLSNAIKTFLVSGFVLIIFQYLVTRHLKNLAEYVRKLDIRRPSPPLVLDRTSSGTRKPDELDEVAFAIDRMQAGLRESFAKLETSESRLKGILDNTQAVIYLKDRAGLYILVNRRFEVLFHLTNEQVRGRTDHDLFPRELADEFRANDLRVIETNRPHQWEEVAPHDDGPHTYLSLKFPVAGADGAEFAVCGISTDITERLEMEEAHRQAREEAEMANAAKSIFLANMSHELRTPLNAINGFAEMMAAEMVGPLPERYRQFATDIHTSGQHLLKVVNDILDMSRIEAGNIDLAPVPVEMGGLIEEAISMLGEQATRKSVSFVRDLDDARTLQVDPLRVKQAFLNVLSNAVKFSTGGTVTVSAERNGEWHEFRVSDTGIGMTENDIRIALLPFGQAEKQAYTRQFEGTGLGLPLARQLVEAHGGTIRMESEPDVGTTVTVSFPEDPGAG
jgi:PAS domain S-box-containing protein